ncbi:AAA family ATPase [Mesorhizobium sp. A623]
MEQKRKRKGLPDGIKSLPQMLAYFGIVRACRGVPALMARQPVVLGIVIPKDQVDLYKKVANVIVEGTRFRLDRDATVVAVDADPRRRTKMESDTWDALREYDRVVVLAESRDHLPERFLLLADAVVDAPPISARDVSGAVRILFNVDMKAADAEVAAAAPLDTLAGAFRKGRPMSTAMRVLRDAATVIDKPKDSGPTLDDLHGLGEAGAWGKELAIDLADWRAGKIQWADVERGILLSGLPGTGKTTFAGALARTCGVTLIVGSLAKWQASGTGHLGDMLGSMRKAFEAAKESAPSILFVDELDGIGDRESFTGDNASYGVQVVNAFLECLDGIDTREGVVVVGACNNPDRIDAAVLRPGRLDRHVIIPLPDADGRMGILRWHLQGALDGEDLTHVVERTEGFSGAALEQLVRQARRTARRARRDMRLGDLAEELPTLVPMPAETLWRTSVHEAGHAVVGLAWGGRWKVIRASVVHAVADTREQQQAGGVLWEDDGMYTASADDYRARIIRSLGGLAAEEIVFGHRFDGGGGVQGSDLYNATVAAAAMEASVGLGSSLAFLSAVGSDDLMRLVQIDHVVRMRVEKVLADCYEQAKEIVRERRSDVERLAHALVVRGKLSGDEVTDILDEQPRLKLVPQAG